MKLLAFQRARPIARAVARAFGHPVPRVITWLKPDNEREAQMVFISDEAFEGMLRRASSTIKEST